MSGNCKYILVVVDYVSKWVEEIPYVRWWDEQPTGVLIPVV
jgi:hypothetical protein